MDVTIYRYVTGGARWDPGTLGEEDYRKVVEDMNNLHFQGYDEERKYGLAQCGYRDGIIYGLFIQKFPTKLIDYDPETKDESIQDAVDSGEYLFIFFPATYEIYFQVKRSANLPNSEEIIKRFMAVLALANQGNRFLFNELKPTEDEINRNRILEIFYTEADNITELELEDFDPQIILEQEQARGSIQKYFNPREKYQEAMKEAGLSFAGHTKKISIKAKRGESFKKDPIARAALEGSRRPVKIVYEKESQTKTEYGVTKRKEILTIESAEFDLDEQIEGIINALRGRVQNSEIANAPEQSDQNSLF
jgi:hypothetical protein